MEKNYVAYDCRNSRNSETLPKKARNGKIVYPLIERKLSTLGDR